MPSIDINCDLGEGTGADDLALLDVVTSANIACGGHAGDENTMAATVGAALARGVAIGAHPGYPDRANFGRVALQMQARDVEEFVYEQIHLLARIAEQHRGQLTHIKLHGALYHQAMNDAVVAGATADAAARFQRTWVMVAMPRTVALRIWRERGLSVAVEAFADRVYEADGSLRSRALPGSLITDPAAAAEQALRLASDQTPGAGPHTICIHSDTPGAVAVAKTVRGALTARGISIGLSVPPPARVDCRSETLRCGMTSGHEGGGKSQGFEDRFSAQAAAYAKHRPVYPPELYTFLAGLAPGRECAWDCGCGNGQAAVAVREHFDRVIASDASAAQIERAQPCAGVDYRVAQSEASGLPDASVQLVTAASALHWFDLPAFYREVRRVLVPRGVIAAWGYRDAIVAPEIDELISDYQNRIVDEFWSSRIRIVANGYQHIDFPFDEIEVPPMDVRATWTADQMLGYLGTWSASQSYLERHGTPATALIEEPLRERWGSEARAVRWPLTARVGKV